MAYPTIPEIVERVAKTRMALIQTAFPTLDRRLAAELAVLLGKRDPYNIDATLGYCAARMATGEYDPITEFCMLCRHMDRWKTGADADLIDRILKD